MANTNSANKTPPANNTTKAPANNTTKAASNNSNNKKNDTKGAGAAGYYTRHIPSLVLIGIFLFFIMFQFLKSQKYKENRLRQRIDVEIRKKLYYPEEYY